MTSAFRSPLILVDTSGLPMELHEPLLYDSALLNTTVIVPAGFKTDLASIPRGLWNVLPKVGPWDKAAVVHDWLYWTDGCTRAQADAVFREALQVCGVGWFRRWLMYLAVRAGAATVWDKYRQRGGVLGA